MNDYSMKIPAATPALTGTASVPAAESLPGEHGRPGAQPSDPFHKEDKKSAERLKIDDNALDLKKFAEELERFIPKLMPNTRLQIIQDDMSGLFVYKAIDRESGEVVHQYPADEILRYIARHRSHEGLILDGTA